MTLLRKILTWVRAMQEETLELTPAAPEVILGIVLDDPTQEYSLDLDEAEEAPKE
jgi:hypothetical protein